MSDSSDDEDSISKIDFSVISMAIEAGHKMVQQILNCVHYGTPEVRNLMYNECDFIVECRVCRNLFRSIPNFVAHKRIYCTAEAEQNIFPSSGQEESVVVVEPTDNSSGKSSKSVSPTTSNQPSSATRQSMTKSTSTAIPTGSVTNAKSVLSRVFSSSTLSQSKTVSQSTSSANVSGSKSARRFVQEQHHSQGQANKGQGHSENKEDSDSSDGDTSTLKQLLTGKFKGKSSEYNFYSRTAEKMEKERLAKEVSTVVMTPIPTNRNAAYLTVTKSGTGNAGQNVLVSQGPLEARKNISQSVAGVMTVQNGGNVETRDKNTDNEIMQRRVPERSSKRKNTDVQKIVNEETATTSRIPEKNLLSSKQKQMEQKNRKFVQLRPVKSQQGSLQYSELSELGLLGHCDLALSRCLLCSVSYSSRKGLLQHMHSIHSGRKILFPCSMCEKRFSYFWGLTRHLQNNHHLTKEKIDKIRDKLKSMAFDTAELEQKELSQKEHSDPKSHLSPGPSPDGSRYENSSVKQTSNLAQTAGSASRPQRESESTGLKLNKCEGCKRAFWKKSNYDEHINQCKWLVSSSVNIDKSRSTTRSRSESGRGETRSRSESARGESSMRATETPPNRPATRSKVTDLDVISSSNVMDNLENIERRARSRTRSRIPIHDQAKVQNDSEKGQIGGATNNKEASHEAMEEDHEDSRDGSELSKSSSTDRLREKEKSHDQKSPMPSPSKRSESGSPITPSKLQMVTRHSAKSLEKETQYMRTRFFDKRRESQIRPDKSPSKQGSESNSPTLLKKDAVKVALAFEGEQNEKMNKSQDCSGSEPRGSEKIAQPSGKEGKINDSKLATRSKAVSAEVSNDKSEESDAMHTRASRDSSRESTKEASLTRPSTRSVQKTTEITKDTGKSHTTPTAKKDGRKSPTETVSRDSSRESLKDGSSRVGTRSGSAQSTTTNRSRSRDEVDTSSVLAKKSRQDSPLEKDRHTKRDSSTENESDRSLSRTRTRNLSKSEDSSKCTTKESSSSRISTRNTPSQMSPENTTKNRSGTESDQDNQDDQPSFQASVRKSTRTYVGMKTDKTEKSKEDNVCIEMVEQDASRKPNQATAEELDSRQKLGGSKSGEIEESRGISEVNVQRAPSRRSGKFDTRKNTTSEKCSNEDNSHSTLSEDGINQSGTSLSMVTRRSMSNSTEPKIINESSTSRSAGLKSSEGVTSKETRSSGTRKTEASEKSREDCSAKGDHSNLNKNEGLEVQKRSARIREKLSVRKDEEADGVPKDSPQSSHKKVDEVDGESGFRSARLAMKAQKKRCETEKNTEDLSQQREVQVGNMIISSMQPAENQNFLGLKVTPYTAKSTSKVSSQFTPRIPKYLESTPDRNSNTISDSNKDTDLKRSTISNAEDTGSDSEESSNSNSEGSDSDLISASPEPEVQLFEEIWVQKEPGLPTEEVKTNAFAMMTYKSSSSQASSKGPSPSSSGHTTRASEKMRNTRTQMYVTDPKNIGTSQESVQTRCLDLSRISYLSDEKEMRCLQCGLGFSCLSNLRRHVVRHLGWRRYKCKLCKFSSYNKSECNTHLIRSHGTKARNCTSSTLIIDLNKEASKVRSQKKINTIKSKTSGPSLRSRSQKKTPTSKSEKTDVLLTESKVPESRRASRGTSQQEKIRKGSGDVIKESAGDKTQTPDQSGTTVVTTRSKTLRRETNIDNIEDNQSTTTGGTADVQSDADAAANLQMKTEELRRTRKRKRSNSEDTNSSKVENKRETTVNDSKKSRKRKRSNSLEVCIDEEQVAANKLESLVVPIKKKYEMKRSTSLDGTSSNPTDDVGETLSDSWDIPSVSDFENSDTETVCSPPSAKVVPNLETMMAALEEARAFKFVRQRGKGRKSLPLVKKTQRSGSLGSQTDSHIGISTPSTTNVDDGEKTQTDVLEVSGVSSSSLNCDEVKCSQAENSKVTSREETDESAIEINKISSDSSNNENLSAKESGSGEQNNSSVKDNSSNDADNLPVVEESSSVKDKVPGVSDNSSNEFCDSSGDQDGANVKVNSPDVTGKQSSSPSVQGDSAGTNYSNCDSSSSTMDSSSSTKDGSSSTKDGSSSTKDSSSSTQDSSSSTMDSSSSTKDSSSSTKDSSSSTKDSSSSTKDSSSSTKDSSSSTKDSSSSTKDSSSSTMDSSSSTKDHSSSTQGHTPGEQENSSGLQDSSSSTANCPSAVQNSSLSEHDDLPGKEDFSSDAQIRSVVTKDISTSETGESTIKNSNVHVSSCSGEKDHSISEKETTECVVDNSQKAEKDSCKETLGENSVNLVEECDGNDAKGDNLSGNDNLGGTDAS